MDRRYDDDQVAEILRRAADLQSEMGSANGQGTTLTDLKRIAEEVGFDPRSIEKAAQELEQKSSGLRAESMGGTTQFDQAVPNQIDDEAWEDIVSELRYFGGRSGVTSTRGSTREWLGGSDVARIMFSARIRGDGTRLRLHLDVGSMRILIGVIGLPLGLVAASIFAAMMSKAGFETGYGILVFLGVVATILAGLCFAVSCWMRSTRRRVSQTFQKIVQRAARESTFTADHAEFVEQLPPDLQTQAHQL